jgi:hypothetical protein
MPRIPRTGHPGFNGIEVAAALGNRSAGCFYRAVNGILPPPGCKSRAPSRNGWRSILVRSARRAATPTATNCLAMRLIQDSSYGYQEQDHTTSIDCDIDAGDHAAGLCAASNADGIDSNKRRLIASAVAAVNCSPGSLWVMMPLSAKPAMGGVNGSIFNPSTLMRKRVWEALSLWR